MLNDKLSVLKGIGESRIKLFDKLSISTVKDLLYYFPRDYEDRSKITTIFEAMENETVCLKATVFSHVVERFIRKGLTIYSTVLLDDTGHINVSWFNNKYIKNQIKKGEEYVFYGKITKVGGKKFIENPIFEKADNSGLYTGKIVPLYPLTANLSQKMIQSAMSEAVKAIDEICETLPYDIRNKYNLAEIKYAVKNIHFPEDFHSYDISRKRFVFEELFMLQTALLFTKTKNDVKHSYPISDLSYKDEFISSLPYSLTGAQIKVIDEICADISRDIPMNRLVQGDVGSGKTVVAACAIYTAVKNGFQAAFMAPTEILAAQHYENFVKMFGDNAKVCLLTGATKKKAEIYQKIANGEYDIIIGTHAIIQENVIYSNLGLIVTDEQHRFGVNQRNDFVRKGNNPHVLVMSATPIPRTLALILYGDLDISIIDELPAGRKKIETYAVGESMRTRINNFIRKHVNDGRQVYIVCPLVEESEVMDLKNVSDYTQNLIKNVFPELRIGLLHGKMPNSAKDEIMQAFKNHELDILVSTTVIEVGVDVSNANVMVIENAERFGLSQLHQLRGRVGRGEHQSYCIMFNQSDSEIAKKRMDTMVKSCDGFYISEQDLKLRGPGDFFGVRQHGLPSMKIANLFTDSQILKLAQEAAQMVLKDDPSLNKDKNNGLKRRIAEMIENISL